MKVRTSWACLSEAETSKTEVGVLDSNKLREKAEEKKKMVKNVKMEKTSRFEDIVN